MTFQQVHHEILGRLKCWQGFLDPGYRVNFLGVKTREHMALLEKARETSENSVGAFVRTILPEFNEEYFQWIDLIESVAQARSQFVMIELGAGYGRWLANAAAALQNFALREFKLIGVEAEPTHFQWMKQHMRDNGIEESNCELFEAAVDTKDGDIKFLIGNPQHWYGQSIWPPETPTLIPLKLKFAKSRLLRRIGHVRSMSLDSLLQPLQHVDLLDLDVQGSELRVLTASRPQVDAKVRRVHIGTHSPEIEDGLRSLFRQLGWKNKFDYPCGHEKSTPYGKISFQDGVQSWVNLAIPTERIL